jgi:nicotinate-nucleotide adenylyltransferase
VTGRYTLVPVPNLPLSSSGLRERVRCGLPIRYLVPEAVRSYIDRHGLYKG